MAAIDNAYQYYLSTYRSFGASRYDTHKPGELRAVCHNIIKTNKDSVFMAAIDNAYQYYLSTYRSFGASRYDTHKPGELRAVCHNIIKTNKDSPLYKIKYSEDAGRFAIDIKEQTRSIQNVIASLSDSGGGIESVFSKKLAQSSDEDVISAEYIGSTSRSRRAPSRM